LRIVNPRMMLALVFIGMLIVSEGLNSNLTIECHRSMDDEYGFFTPSYENVTIHEGDLIIDGTQTFLIENCTYIQVGNVFIKDSATLILRKTELFLNLSFGYQYRIWVLNNANITIIDATIIFSKESSFDFTDNSKGFLNKAKISSTVWVSCQANVFILNSETGWIVAEGSSYITAKNLTSGWIRVLGFVDEVPTVYLSDCRLQITTIGFYDCDIKVTGLKKGFIKYFNTYQNISIIQGLASNLTIEYSDVEIGIGLELFGRSFANITQCSLSHMDVNDVSTVVAYRSSFSHQIVATGHSTITVTDGEIYLLSPMDESSTIITNCTILGLDPVRDKAYVSISSTPITFLTCIEFSGLLQFDQVTIERIYELKDSNFYITGNVNFGKYIKEWVNSTIIRRFNVLVLNMSSPTADANLTVYDESNQVIWNGFSDMFGRSNFNLTFADANFTNTLRLEAKKVNLSAVKTFSFLSESPIILELIKHRTIYVDDDNVAGPWYGTEEYPFKNITMALKYAIDGDTIFVRSGAYYENIIVNKSVSLVGENAATTMIDGSYAQSTIHIIVNNVNVTGFTIKKGGHDWPGAGVFLDGAGYCNISENIFIENSIGVLILAASANSNIIYLNNFTSNGDGIWLDSSYNNVVSENVLIGNGRGIHLRTSYGNRLRSNVMINNTNNFFVFGYEPYQFVNDIDVSNIINGKPIYYWIGRKNETVPSDAGYIALVNCISIKVQGFTLSHNGQGVLLVNTTETIVKNNTLKDNESHGIQLTHSSNNTIQGNSLINNGIGLYHSSNNNINQNNVLFTRYVSYIGLYLFYSSNNTVVKNNFSKTGMWVFNSYKNLVESNTVNGKPLVYLEGISDRAVEEAGQVILVRSKNITVENLNISWTSFGIQLWQTNCSKIKNNNLTNNVFGVELDAGSCYNTISGNNITANSYAGIQLFGGFGSCRCNNISENTIANNHLGVWIRFSSNNKICHNNFINNWKQVEINYGEHITPDAVNVWDDGYPSGGNYWSDYIGEDSNGDGIGDTPYVINANNTDRHPLMSPFGGLTSKGQNVTAYPSEDVCLIFENVTGGGLTSVNISDVGPEPPSGFKLAGKYYDIETTANFSGIIRLRISYDDSNMTEMEENNLHLMQWDETLQEWIDITTLLDTENNVIYGKTTHLSIFAITTIRAIPSGGFIKWKALLIMMK